MVGRQGIRCLGVVDGGVFQPLLHQVEGEQPLAGHLGGREALVGHKAVNHFFVYTQELGHLFGTKKRLRFFHG